MRSDAGFIGPAILSMLDERELSYALRYPVDADLKAYEEINGVRSPGRPPGYQRTLCHGVEYRALAWSKPRCVVHVVIEMPGELFPKSLFIVTSFTKEWLCG